MEGGIKILGRDSGEIMRSMFCLVSNMSDWSTGSQQKEGPERDHWNHRKAWLRMQYPRKWAAVWETKVMKMLWKKTQCKPLADRVRDAFKMGGVIWRRYKNTYACVWYLEKAPEVAGMRSTIMMGCKRPQSPEHHVRDQQGWGGDDHDNRKKKTSVSSRAFSCLPTFFFLFFFFSGEGYCLTVYKSQPKNKKNVLASESVLKCSPFKLFWCIFLPDQELGMQLRDIS